MFIIFTISTYRRSKKSGTSATARGHELTPRETCTTIVLECRLTNNTACSASSCTERARNLALSSFVRISQAGHPDAHLLIDPPWLLHTYTQHHLRIRVTYSPLNMRARYGQHFSSMGVTCQPEGRLPCSVKTHLKTMKIQTGKVATKIDNNNVDRKIDLSKILANDTEIVH
jgi:hypothetical protein